MAALARSTSAASIPTNLRHPTPMGSASASGEKDSPFGSWSNRSAVMNLEQQAEEMSQGGSDIGEEIRRMNEESKERSRQSSIQSSHQGDFSGSRGTTGAGLERYGSSRSRASSHAQSVGAARWGGYSPGGYVGSPVGSIHSGSWSHASVARKASASGSSRLAQMVEPLQEGKPLDSPLAPSNASFFSNDNALSPQASQSSFAQRYDQIAGQIEEQLEDIASTPPQQGGPGLHHEAQHDRGYGHLDVPERPHSSDTFREAREAFKDFDGVHFNPDTEEFVQVDENGEEIRRVSARTSSGTFSTLGAASMLRTPRARPNTQPAPPPEEGMVYYPAPVPRMLNLPKRLSRLPAASVQAKKRTQMLNQLSPEARQSAPWLPELNLGGERVPSRGSHQSQGSGSHHSDMPKSIFNERMSVRNLQNIPPQLRANLFFDHQALQQDVDIKSESAVATLDNILAASTHAPVSAFTDHPYAGDVRRTVYGPENPAARRSTATVATAIPAESGSPTQAKKKKRHSTISNLLRRTSSGDKLTEQLRKNASRSSLLTDFNEGGKKLQKRQSQMSLGDGLEKRKSLMSLAGQPVTSPGNEMSEPDLAGGLISQAHNGEAVEEGEARSRDPSRPGTAHSRQRLNDDQQIAEDFREMEREEDVEEGEPVYAQPTTLLAELQVRKANQKSRNRTAVTAFPNGMHSTLLQLDAVHEIERRKRQQSRVPLAWEDPSQHVEEVDSDDEVPLGMLYPGNGGMVAGKSKVGDGRDWDRPLGLMERRELEENEPLRSRRNRLQGLPHDHGSRPSLLPNASQIHLAGQPDIPEEQKAQEEAEPDEHEGETLGERVRRLKTKQQLDAALGDAVPKDGSRPTTAFTDDILSQFGGLDVKEASANPGKDTTAEKATTGGAAPAPAPEDETLGQRRARLQREREASGEHQPSTANGKRPDLRSSKSLANLLATNPVNAGGTRKPTNKSYEPLHGTLLHTSAQQQAASRSQLNNTNMRASSYYGLEKPSTNPTVSSAMRPRTTAVANGSSNAFLGHQYHQSSPSGFGFGGFQPQPLQTSASTPFGIPGGGGGSYFPQQQQQQQVYHHPMMNPGMNVSAYQALNGGMPGVGMMAGGGGGGGYGYGGAGMGMGMGVQDQPLNNKRRDAIDQWRMSVGH
ncbi:hypothetical protein KC363_g4691 [Hortaea werneckii]|uniref:Uncharacterized protein n=1 Tax=Hortaea werneckii TaxID=91943 RepID=A0A3M7FL62_HORWE|nr:hypothetical protein KC363_g4691 [Hortaea werneckii]RMY89387.1 hypothetical protein D0861_04281 [Hortaea werneckii]